MSALAADIQPPAPTARRLNLVEGAAALHEVFDRIDADRIPAGQASRVVEVLARARSRLDALTLRAVAEAGKEKVAEKSGASGTGAWLARVTNTDGAKAARDASLANALNDGLDLTRDALEAGKLNKDHAGVIANTVAKLPDGLSTRDRERIERSLVGQAKFIDPAKLARAARRALAAAEREASEVDAHEDALLRSEEERAYRRCWLTMHDNFDGTTSGKFVVPTLQAAILKKALQQMTAPRRNNAGCEPGGGEGAFGGAPVAAARYGAPGPGSADYGDWAHRYGLAFAEVLEHLPTDRLHGKVAATVVVTVAHDALRAALGAAQLDTDHDLSAGMARKLACEAGILPAVLGGGGQTNLDRAVPLCGYHHRRIHDPAYMNQIRESGGKKIVVLRRRT